MKRSYRKKFPPVVCVLALVIIFAGFHVEAVKLATQSLTRTVLQAKAQETVTGKAMALDAPAAQPPSISSPTQEHEVHTTAPEHVTMVAFETFKTITVKLLDSSIVDIRWASNSIAHDAPVIVYALTNNGQLYRSADSGMNWENQSSHLNDEKIVSMHVSKVDATHSFFLGASGKNFYTTDSGASYGSTDHALADIRMHPTQATWMLGSNESPHCQTLGRNKSPVVVSNGEPDENVNCYMRLFVTEDMGKSWTQIATHIVQYDWGVVSGAKDEKTGQHPSDDTIIVTGYLDKNRPMKINGWDQHIHLMETKNYFKNWQVLVPHGNRFFSGQHGHLFAAQVDLEDESKVNLMVWHNTTDTFEPAHVPSSLSHHSYTILDSSDQTVFLHINHRPLGEVSHTGHLYVSDAYGSNFTLSLPNNERSPEGFCAFTKVEGMEGVYLSNYVTTVSDDKTEIPMGEGDDAESVNNRRVKKHPVHSKTAISFDKGSEWFFLQAPEKDCNGNVNTVCKDNGLTKDQCHLQLHGLARDEYGPFYSDRNAVGMILATGSIGEFVQSHTDGVNTYLSRDAGYTFVEVFRGSHTYEFGDHGGLLVMAQDVKPTDILYYSWDEGATWEGVKFVSSPFVVENIVIEPSNTDVRFLVYGSHSDSGAGVLVHIDFADLHERMCVGQDAVGTKDSDYELWTPHDDRYEGRCLMGHETQYLRKKQLSKCFNPMEHMPARTYHDCQCVRADFQCDYGYMKRDAMEKDSPCIVDTEDDQVTKYGSLDVLSGAAQIHTCTGPYYVTKGYRKIAGNTCQGGTEWEPVLTQCGGATKWSVMLLVILIVVALSLTLVALSTKYDLADVMTSTYESIMNKAGKYKLIKPKSQYTSVHANDDDEDGELDLNEDEFTFDDDEERPAAGDVPLSKRGTARHDGATATTSSEVSPRKTAQSQSPTINASVPRLQAPTEGGMTIVSTDVLGLE